MKRPRGSRGGRKVQELREKGELPAAGSKAAQRLNAKRDKARKFAEKKAEKKARRQGRLEERKASTGSVRSSTSQLIPIKMEKAQLESLMQGFAETKGQDHSTLSDQGSTKKESMSKTLKHKVKKAAKPQ